MTSVRRAKIQNCICALLILISGFASAQIVVNRARVAEVVSKGLLIKSVAAEYPADVHVSGSVVFQALIGKDGTVQQLRVISGDPMLIPNAMATAKQYKYRPYQLNGEPVEMDTRITIRFEPRTTSEEQDKPLKLPEKEALLLCSGLCGKLPPRVYPKEALEKHLEGSVVLRAVIDTKGNVKDVSAVSGDPIFIPAAIKAVNQWKYTPYRKNGQAVEVEVPITVNFHITN